MYPSVYLEAILFAVPFIFILMYFLYISWSEEKIVVTEKNFHKVKLKTLLKKHGLKTNIEVRYEPYEEVIMMCIDDISEKEYKELKKMLLQKKVKYKNFEEIVIRILNIKKEKIEKKLDMEEEKKMKKLKKIFK